MALAPLSQTVILTEDGISIEPKEQVAIPPFVPSFLTLFEGGRYFNTLRPSDVPGFLDAVRAIDAVLISKGRSATLPVSAPIAAPATGLTPRNLADVVAGIMALANKALSFRIRLDALTMSTPLVAGIPSAGTIFGLVEGSSLASTVTGLSIDRETSSYAFDGSGPGSGELIEAHPDYWNSPRSTPLTVDPPNTANTFFTSSLLATEIDGAVAILTPIVTKLGY